MSCSKESCKENFIKHMIICIPFYYLSFYIIFICYKYTFKSVSHRHNVEANDNNRNYLCKSYFDQLLFSLLLSYRFFNHWSNALTFIHSHYWWKSLIIRITNYWMETVVIPVPVSVVLEIVTSGSTYAYHHYQKMQGITYWEKKWNYE